VGDDMDACYQRPKAYGWHLQQNLTAAGTSSIMQRTPMADIGLISGGFLSLPESFLIRSARFGKPLAVISAAKLGQMGAAPTIGYNQTSCPFLLILRGKWLMSSTWRIDSLWSRGGIVVFWFPAALLSLAAEALAASVYDVRFAAVQGDPVGNQTLSVVGSQVVANNDLGEIVFAGDSVIRSIVDAAGQRHLSFVPLGNPQLNGLPLTGAFDPSIDDSGHVAYQGAFGPFGSNYGVVLNGQVMVSTQEQVQGSPITYFSEIVHNNSGQVLSAANTDSARAYFLNDHAVVESGTVIDGISIRDLSPWPALNDAGMIAFCGGWATGSGVFTTDHKIAATGDTIEGYELQFIDSGVALNNAGEVVFFARFNGGEGLFSADHLLVQTGDVIDGHTITFISERPAINDLGDIVFTAQYDSGNFGIFTRERLIASVGDIVDGRELLSVGQSSNGSNKLAINNRGEIVFHTFLADGGGVVLARPIPEPATITLISILGASGFYRRRVRPTEWRTRAISCHDQSGLSRP
jgi:hypothetical protein